MQRSIVFLTILFISFLFWTLYMANTEQDAFMFRIARSLPFGDKIAHVLVFGSLALLLNLSIKLKSYNVSDYAIPWGAIVIALFALLEEASQVFFPSRTVDPWDFLASLTGIFLFSHLSNYLHQRIRSFAK